MKKMNKGIYLMFFLLTLLVVLASCGGDKTLPTLSGTDDIVYTIGDPEPNLEDGISALDDTDGDLSASVIFDDSAVDFTTPGVYNVSVTVTDAAGNEASMTFTVTVQYEQVLPVISGVVDLEFEQGVIEPEFLTGVTAEDNTDGVITNLITVDDSAVNYLVVGTYNITYTVSDTAGNVGTATASVFIREETVNPVIEGAVNLEFDADSTDLDFLVGLSAIDNVDGDLTSEITVDSNAVDSLTPGTYPVIYTVVDSAGNSFSVTVQVKIRDTIAPVITGSRNLTFEVNTQPNLLWKDIRATDNLDGDILDKVVIDSSELNLNLLGVYPITYSVTDSSGNTTSVTVQITMADRTKPVISSAPAIYYLEGADAPDYLAGVTALDNYDGDLTASITVDTTDVDLNTIGSYDVIYTVVDTQGNTGTLTIQLIVPNPTNVANVDSDALAIDLPTTPITASITLPRDGAAGSTIRWVSAQPGVVTDKGNIIRPGIGEADAEVELIATIKNGNYEVKEVYVVVVAAMTEANVTSKKTLDYTALGTEYITSDGVLETYFIDNGSVPYVDVEEFIMLLEGALDTTIIEFVYDGVYLTISYSIEYEEIDGSMVTEDLTAIFDFELNTFTVETFNFFEYYVQETTSDYGEGLNYVDAEYVDSHPVTFPIGYYGFDLVIYNDLGTDVYLIPFHIADLLFLGNMYYDVYYNGDQYYGLDTTQLYDRADSNLPTIRTSSYNTRAIPLDMKVAAYNYMAFAMDFYYGIKNFAGIETYYDGLSEYTDSMVYGGDYVFYESIYQFVYGLDDLHTSHVFTGYYEDPSFGFTLALSDLGTRSQSYYSRMWSTEDLYEARFGSLTDIPFSRITDDGKTAIIYIEGFDIDTPTKFMRELDLLPTTVENVVIDLANNGGGNIGAVLRIFGYMTEETFTYHSQNPADGSAATYFIESDYVAYDYNWFVMTSSVTFSAANLFASMAKELGIPVIGQDASGGASSIGIILPPGGSTLLISTNNVLSSRVMNDLGEYEYLSVEYGIKVDYKLSDVTDDTEISTLIDQILGN